MRSGVAVLFLFFVGCSSEAARETSPKVNDVTVVTAADSPKESSSTPSENASPSDSPRATEPTQSSEEPHDPALLHSLEPSCPIPASTCPDRCAPIFGWRFEKANQCYSPVVVACLPGANGTYAMNSDLGCYKRDDGVIIATSPSTVGHKLGPGWSGCDPYEDFPKELPRCQSHSGPSD